jgi:hypothetical protein
MPGRYCPAGPPWHEQPRRPGRVEVVGVSPAPQPLRATNTRCSRRPPTDAVLQEVEDAAAYRGAVTDLASMPPPSQQPWPKTTQAQSTQTGFPSTPPSQVGCSPPSSIPPSLTRSLSIGSALISPRRTLARDRILETGRGTEMDRENHRAKGN